MIWIRVAFVCFVLFMLALDLGVFHHQSHIVSMKEALGWSLAWVLLGLGFAVFVYYGYENRWLGMGLSIDSMDGQMNDATSATVKYLTGYVLEKSLSVDNFFVIAMVFGFFAVPLPEKNGFVRSGKETDEGSIRLELSVWCKVILQISKSPVQSAQNQESRQ
ncbi:MAG: hypothetical protein ACYC0X_12385 [Pirellulaceae bacterium]